MRPVHARHAASRPQWRTSLPNLEVDVAARAPTRCRWRSAARTACLILWNSPSSFEVRNFEGPLAKGTGHFGFHLEWPVTAKEATDIGSYAVTAP
jgi:hypothetical protein